MISHNDRTYCSPEKGSLSRSDNMKKWSLIVAGLYGLAFVVLGLPLAWIAFAPEGPTLSDYAEGFLHWQTWTIIAVMILAQWALLRVPVALAAGRSVAQRSIWSTVIASAFMMGLLALGAVVSIYETATRDTADDGFGIAVGIGLLSWIGWSIYFYRATSRSSSSDHVTTLRRHLWAGSILELLIAIPTHIVARQRDYCCAGLMTFLGLTCGFAVMVFAFGPALYFLFVDRWKRLHPQRL